MTTAEELAFEVIEAFHADDVDRIGTLVTDDFVDHGAPPGLVPPGPDGYLAVLRFLVDVLQIRYEVHDVVADGDWVAIRATAHGVHRSDHLGVPATGKPRWPVLCTPCTVARAATRSSRATTSWTS